MGARLTVGLLGGAGTAAAELLIALRSAGVRVIVDSDPEVFAPGAASPALALAAMAQGLERAGADLLALADDTAHAFQFEIERRVGIPFISMIEETGAAVAALAPRGKVELLADETWLATGLYQTELARRGLTCLPPEASDADVLIVGGAASPPGVVRIPLLRPLEVMTFALTDYALGRRPPPAPFSWTEVGKA